MADRRLRFLQLDVFTTTPFAGNQLAVFPDAQGLTAATMQQIAREMAFSESTFFLPAATADTDTRLRIFTPGRELPIAGHPVVGSTYALAHLGRLTPDRTRFVYGLGIGPTPVDLEWREGRLAFVWMTQPLPDFGPVVPDRGAVATALSVNENDVLDAPIQTVSCGNPFLFVPLATRRAVDAAALDVSAFARLVGPGGTETLGVFVFSTEPADPAVTAYSRMFAPAFGIPEDPATGSASGPLGCYLVRHRLVEAGGEARFVSAQGVKMGRPSEIHIAIRSRSDQIVDVKVGGQAVCVGDGELFL